MSNGSAVFSEQETAWHRTARFQFVSWVARLLGDGPLRGKSNPLPVGNPDALTDETIGAVRDMMNRAVWKFLARDCGWRQQHAVSFSTHGGEGTFNKRRLWHGPSNAGLPPIQFTADSLDLLLSVYNSTRSNAHLQDQEPPACHETNGDLFLHHLVFRRLSRSAPAAEIEANSPWRPWLFNPLNALFHIDAILDPETPVPDWDRLMEPDVAACFPWIAARIARDWRSRRDTIWRTPETAGDWFGSLAEHLRGLIDSAVGRPDLLVFLLDEFAHQAESADDDLEQFETIAASLNRQDREQIAVPWSEFLKIADNLRLVHQACVDLHPIERSAPENCFLAAWQEVTFSEVADRLKTLRQQVRPTIS